MAEAEADRLGARLQGGHAVILPFPASGHIAPFIPFARSLARYGVAITFLCPRHELSKVSALVDDERFDARENVKLVTFEVRIEGGLNWRRSKIWSTSCTRMWRNSTPLWALLWSLARECKP
jgi:UDP:flavonoid glycosyltransferase YjiC (YdhE family)